MFTLNGPPLPECCLQVAVQHVCITSAATWNCRSCNSCDQPVCRDSASWAAHIRQKSVDRLAPPQWARPGPSPSRAKSRRGTTFCGRPSALRFRPNWMRIFLAIVGCKNGQLSLSGLWNCWLWVLEQRANDDHVMFQILCKYERFRLEKVVLIGDRSKLWVVERMMTEISFLNRSLKRGLRIFLENDPDWTRLKLAIIKNGWFTTLLYNSLTVTLCAISGASIKLKKMISTPFMSLVNHSIHAPILIKTR